MKPEASSGGGGGDRPRFPSHHPPPPSNSSTPKDKVRCPSFASSFTPSVYRSMSEPGFLMLEPERAREERVVVKAYGNVAPPSPPTLGLLPALSPSQVMPVTGILEGRDVSGSGRKRLGRKSRRPEGYGGLSPENGFSTSFQIGRFSCTLSSFTIACSSSLRRLYFAALEEALITPCLAIHRSLVCTLLGFPFQLSFDILFSNCCLPSHV